MDLIYVTDEVYSLDMSTKVIIWYSSNKQSSLLWGVHMWYPTYVTWCTENIAQFE